MTDTIKVSEIFYSIQGEGTYTGFPSLFIRLAGCNLNCPWCDTKEVWKKGEEISIFDLFYKIDRTYGRFLDKGIHVVITGGEPSLQTEQIDELVNNYLSPRDIFVELETNASIDKIPSADYYNISPKFLNDKWRVNDETISNYARCTNVGWKFVIENELDAQEALDFLDHYNIRSRNPAIFFMPLSNNREEAIRNSKKVIEICKKTNIQYSPRLQLFVYNKCNGV